MKNLKESLNTSFFSQQFLNSNILILENVDPTILENDPNVLSNVLFFTKKTPKSLSLSMFFDTKTLKFPLSLSFFSTFFAFDNYISKKLNLLTSVFIKTNYNFILRNTLYLTFLHNKKVFLILHWFFCSFNVKN